MERFKIAGGIRANIYPLLIAAITGGFAGQVLDFILDGQRIDLEKETISIQVLQQVNKTCREENQRMRADNAILRADFLKIEKRLSELENR